MNTQMKTQDEKQDTFQTAAYNPFPEPQTIPTGWDTSEFFSPSQPIPDQQEDESNERNAD